MDPQPKILSPWYKQELQRQRELRDLRAQLTRAEKVIEASRRHIRSFEPGTLIGSELSLACELRDLDGDIWEPWCVPGELEYGRPSAPERDGRER